VVVSDGQGLRGAGGADVILATSNSYKAAADTLRGLRPDGRLMFIGASYEPFTIPSPGEFLMNRHQIIGSSQNGREYLYEALDYVAKGKVKVMAETFPLDDVTDAYEKDEVSCPRIQIKWSPQRNSIIIAAEYCRNMDHYP
jgi:D-arabinose 1-dehydrogenase-like Zn-dependent alcohol dehydrogenase